jgi:inner membrane protein
VIGFFGPVAYLLHHRGVTHSLLLLPLWALLYSWLLAKLLREPGGWRALYGVTALGLGLHIAGDVITSFGTMVLAPFSDWRAQIGTTFIIDLWFTGIIVAGLALSAILGRSRWPAVAASAFLAGYVGFQYLQKEKATEFGERYARAQGLRDASVNAQARPVSPFNWTVFVSDAEAHRFAHVNLVRQEPRTVVPEDGFIARLDSIYLPLLQARWETRARFGEGALKPVAREAWNSPAMAVYRWFADLPAFDGTSTGSTCVWFIDLRFFTPGRDRPPFRYGACRDRPGGPWRLVPP